MLRFMVTIYLFSVFIISCLKQGVQNSRALWNVLSSWSRLSEYFYISLVKRGAVNIIVPSVLLLITGMSLSHASDSEPQKWVGVDERVVEKIAADHGRPPAEPLINTDQGDLLLFVFLGAGAAGGFAAGYYWHKLISSPQASSGAPIERQD